MACATWLLPVPQDQAADPKGAFDTLGDTYTGGARYGRDTRDLFKPH